MIARCPITATDLTNVLAYAQDLDAPHKRERSRQLIAEVAASGNGVISTHVLQEYYCHRGAKNGCRTAGREVQDDESFRITDLQIRPTTGLRRVPANERLTTAPTARSRARNLRKMGEVCIAAAEHQSVLQDERRDPHVVRRYRCPLLA